MRINPVLALAVLLVPSTLNAGLASKVATRRLGINMCREQMAFVDAAQREGDTHKLTGLLLPQGVSIASPDRSFSDALLSRAADAWNHALGGTIVRVAKSSANATVLVSKVDTCGDCDESQGTIEVDRAEDGSLSATVLIDATVDGRNLTDKELSAVLTHEIGHFLGLDDLPGQDRIMGEFDPKHLVVRPSPEEARAVSQLRETIRACRVKCLNADQ